jgi:hypothetical protein
MVLEKLIRHCEGWWFEYFCDVSFRDVMGAGVAFQLAKVNPLIVCRAWR